MGTKRISQKNNFSIVGKVLYVGMPIYFSEKMSKRLLVIELWTMDGYKNEFAFDFINNRMALLDKVRVNDVVDIVFQLRGRKVINEDGKVHWYNTIEGLAVTILNDKEDGN